MPQWRRLTAGVLFAIASIAALLNSSIPFDERWPIAAACAVIATPLLLVWHHKRQRDRRIIQRAAIDYAARSPQQVRPPMEITTGDDLFVPEPLDK